MPKRTRRWVFIAGLICTAILTVPAVVWYLLTYEPSFYRVRSRLAPEQRRAVARQFARQSLQLRNDIANEPRWEARFSDEEVNAWLAEDLVTHFADQIPEGVNDPRVAFEPDRATLAFQLEQGPVRSVIWVVVGVRVPEPNALALTIEKIRAGVMPVPAEKLLGRITDYARSRGLDVQWQRDGEHPVALVRYQPDAKRRDIILESIQLLDGQIRLLGRSEQRDEAVLKLPTRRVLQSTFPRRSHQPTAGRSADPRAAAILR